MLKHIAAAYYPEHWDEGDWPRDLQLMRDNGIDTVRVFEFAWSRLERADEAWDFDWVHRFMKLAEDARIRVVLCTPSASPPRWLTLAHPECLAAGAHHGHRRHYCPTSPAYREFCKRIARKMHEELGGYSNLVAWQIDNELGFNRCQCGQCNDAFRLWARRQYPTLEALNQAWGGAFWSIDFWDWDEVCLTPVGPPEIRHAFHQFYSDTIVDFCTDQYQALRDAGSAVPISTNFMGNFDQIDYWKMARHVDFVGWDNYAFLFTLATNSFAHNLMRSVKGGQATWTFENGVDMPPGFNIPQALSAGAHGEEVHTLFRWRTCSYSHEMDLTGLLNWGGRPREKLGEIRRLREILDELADVDLPEIRNRIAVVFSYQNYWSTGKYYGDYWNEVGAFYEAVFTHGFGCDCAPPDGDLSGYDLVLAPGLAMVSDEELENFRAYVRGGGVLVAGRKTFSKTPSASYRISDHPALGDVFGLRVAESEEASDTSDIHHSIYKPPFPERKFALAGEGDLPDAASDGWFEVLEADGATPLYTYQDGDYRGRPAACANDFGDGKAFYLGVMIGPDALRAVVSRALVAAGIDDGVDLPDGAQIVRRGDVCVVTNHTREPVTVPLPGAGQTLAGAPADGDRVQLPPWGYSFVRIQ